MTIKLFSLIKELLGRDIDINKFNDRLILQKLTYILKNAGLDFGYRFNWHIRGPYSISLSSDAFEFYQNPDRGCVEISDKDKRYLREIRNFLSQDINNAEKLELIVQGADDLSNFVMFRKALENIPGVVDVQTKQVEPGQTTMAILFKGSAQELADALMLKTFAMFGISINKISANHLNIELIQS